MKAVAAFGVTCFVSTSPNRGSKPPPQRGPKVFQIHVRGNALEVTRLIDQVKAVGLSTIAMMDDSPCYGIRDRQRLGK